MIPTTSSYFQHNLSHLTTITLLAAATIMTQRPNPKTGCLTAVVRRLLCSGSQQTHPSDNILDSEETLQLLLPYEEIEEPKKEIKTETQPQNDDVSLNQPPPPPPPNVVAKLMGLDDPAPGSKRFRYFDDFGSAVARSKSVNFMDYILKVNEEEEKEEDEDKEDQRKCRRVKASVSFREIVPTSSRWSSNNNQQKKHDFLLLYLDKLDEKRELVGSSSFSRSKRFDKVQEDSKKPPLPLPVKKKENEKVAKKFKDEPRKVAKKKKSENRNDVNGTKKVRWFLSPSKSKSPEKMALLGGDESKNIPADEFIRKENESPENKSNASPVSVLDRDLYDYLILDDDYYFSGDSESASELSTKQVDTTTKSSCSSSPARTKTNTKKENNNNDSEETEFITKLMNMLSDLSEEDMKSSTWVSTSSTKPVDFTQVEDFCAEFGQEILELVIDQFVDELCI